MIAVDEAIANIQAALAPTEEIAASLDDAAGATLAAPVTAQIAQPPFDASAMDGYAVRADEAEAGATLTVVGESAAGARFDGEIGPGQAVRIFTGAPVPKGADAVAIQEDVERDGDRITLSQAAVRGRHIRMAGVDFSKGDTLLESGAILTGPALCAAASANNERVAIRRPPTVALIANGDELKMPGDRLGQDDIICSIPYGLAPMIERLEALYSEV